MTEGPARALSSRNGADSQPKALLAFKGSVSISKRKYLHLVVAAAMSALALLLVACGGDDSSDSANGVAAVETEAADGADVQTDAGEAIDLSAMTDGECLKVGNALTGVISRGMVGDFGENLATFRSFVSGAPDATRSEIDTFLNAYEEAVAMLDGAGISLTDAEAMQDPGTQTKVNEANSIVETTEVEAGLQAAEDFLFETCPVLAG